MQLLESINNYMPYIIIGFALMLVLLLILCFISLLKIKKLRKRYDRFMGIDDKLELSLEQKLNKYIESVNSVEHQYSSLLEILISLDKNLVKCSQKVGVIRFNPFDEMGGKLSFAVAILDGNDDGVVFNGLHSRSGSFTYAKPIEKGVSEYVLSDEEKQAIEKAKRCTFNSKLDIRPIEKKIKLYKVNVSETKTANTFNKYIVEKEKIYNKSKEINVQTINQSIGDSQEHIIETEIEPEIEPKIKAKEIILKNNDTNLNNNLEIPKNQKENEIEVQNIEEIQNNDIMTDTELNIKNIIKNSLLK